jgi:hypothetical protein
VGQLDNVEDLLRLLQIAVTGSSRAPDHPKYARRHLRTANGIRVNEQAVAVRLVACRSRTWASKIGIVSANVLT